MRPFVHVNGAKAAVNLSKEAVRGIAIAVGVAFGFKMANSNIAQSRIGSFYTKN
jgi:hypothetical protein